MSINATIIRSNLSLLPAFGLGLGVAVSVGLARFAYALLLPAMRESLSWNYVAAGSLNTANALGYIVGAVSAYFLLRKIRPSQLFITGLLLTIVAVLATGLRSDLLWLTSTRLLAGIGAAWVFACGGALVAARYHAHQTLRRVATGLFFAGAGIGIAASGLVVNPIIAMFGNPA
ncbi:MAG: MFS transporter, partial [Acidithiobacillus ferrivorans]